MKKQKQFDVLLQPHSFTKFEEVSTKTPKYDKNLKYNNIPWEFYVIITPKFLTPPY